MAEELSERLNSWTAGDCLDDPKGAMVLMREAADAIDHWALSHDELVAQLATAQADQRKLDAVVRALGIEDSEDDPVEVLKARLAGAADQAFEEVAILAEDFSWSLPMFDEERLNEITDDVACDVGKQLAAAVRAKKCPAARETDHA